MIEVIDLSGNAPYVAPRGRTGSPSGREVSGTFAANGESPEFIGSGKIAIRAQGTFGSGTVTIYRFINNQWAVTSQAASGSAAAYTAAFDFACIEAKADARYKLVLTGSTNPSITYYLGTTPRDRFGNA